MRRILRLTVPAVIVLLTLVLSALWATPALADDGTPPNTAPAGVSAPASAAPSSTNAASAPAADGSASTTNPAAAAPADVTAPASAAPSSADAAAPADVTAPASAAPSSADAAAAPADVSAPASAAPSSADAAPAAAAPADVSAPASNTASNSAGLLSRVPKGTRIVVTDASGKAVPLASQKAAQAVVKGDPMWCPTGVNPGGAGCTGPQPSFNALLAFMTNKTVPGTIWIESTVTDTSAITLSSLTVGTTANYALTLKGGWTGSGTTINTAAPSTFTVPLTINWNSDVTLSDIVITNVQGSSSTALTITTPRSVTLTRVNVHDNNGAGANIDNTSSTTASAVTVSSSTFSSNTGGDGLDIYSKGAITVSSLIADSNGLHATILDNCIANGGSVCANVTPMPVTMSGTNVFNNNFYGLEVDSKGAITVNNLTGNSDIGGYGAFLRNNYATTPQAVTMTGTNIFDSDWAGLYISSVGAITANQITADLSTSGNDGAYISNQTAAAPQPVTLTGTNEFNSDHYTGLYIGSKGALTLNNITANSSATGAGVYLDNCIQNGLCTGSGAVTLTGTNQFNGNYFNGLEVYSDGNISANNLNASGNSKAYDGTTYSYQWSGGVLLDNDYPGLASPTVTVTGNNTFTGNYELGLVVFSNNNITTNNLTGSGNGLKGAVPQYIWAGVVLSGFPGSPKLISVNGTNVFNSNFGDGLVIETTDIVTTNNLTGNGNTNGDGAYIDNCFYISGQCLVSGAPTLTMTGTNIFNGNSAGGLQAISYGNITAANLNVSGNTTYGVWLFNNLSTSATTPVPSKGTVTLTGTNIFNSNTSDGLDVESNGVITLTNITANGNGQTGDLSNGLGSNIENDFTGATAGVTVAGTNQFNGNLNDGLFVQSHEVITVNNITANDNGQSGDPSTSGWGAALDNTSASSAQPVTLTGTNQFNSNEGTGLGLFSNGAITASNLTANGNLTWNGVYLRNDSASAAQPVTVNGSVTNNNNVQGLIVYSKGLVTLSNITASSNGSYNAGTDTYSGNGVHVDNTAGVAGVTLTGTNTINSNWTNGLDVASKGAISINNLTADNNGYYDTPTDTFGDHVYGYGATINNSTALTAQAITLTGVNAFDYNWSGGLNALSKGAITLTDVDAVGNKSDGAYLDNTAGTVAAGVTLTNTNVFSENVGFGLEVHTNGAITANNLVNNSNVGAPNGWSGAYLDNCGSGLGTVCTTSTVAPVTLTGSNQFKFNAVGLIIFSNGAVTLSNLTDNDNSGGSGLWLDNSHSPIFAGVTLTGINAFNRNNGTGLSIFTRGPVTISNLASTNNGFGANTVLCGTNTSGCGADIENYTAPTPQPVTLTGSSFMTGNYSTNLYVYTKGAITINNLESDNSQNGLGAWLNNQAYGSLTTTPGVTLTGYAAFGNNYLTGINIWSWGNISLANVSANNNGQGKDLSSGGGVYLDNCLYNSGTGLCTATLPRTVTLTGNNNFNNNYTDGLNVNSLGAISVNNVNADNNGTGGVYLDNNYTNAVGAVSITNTPTYQPDFSNNGYYNNSYNGEYNGLDILSRGAITVMDLNAQNNTGDGIYLDNTANTSGTASVTLGTARANWSNWISWNTDSGLKVYSNGLVTLSNLNAENNGHYNPATYNSSGYGVWVNNSTSSLSQGVTLNGTWNGFMNNYLSGLEIYTKGAVTTNRIDANNNGYNNPNTALDDANVYGYGVLIDNCAYNHGTSQCTILTPKAITLNSYNNFNNNYSGGLYVYSNGAITANAVNSNNNIAGSGASFINNANAAAPQSVTLNMFNGSNNNFYGNGGTGLFVQSFGLVTLNSVNADTNKVDGIHVDNATGALASQLKGVTILGYADVYNNPGYGLYINSLGAISINTIDAENQNGIGAYIDNSSGNPGAGVTFTGNINTSNNKNEGMDVYSRGTIAFNNLTGTWIGNNGSYGWNLDNNYPGAVGGITMTIAVNQNFGFDNNGGYGLSAQSLGAITTNNLDANGNNGFGATLDNEFPGVPGAVTTATITVNDPSTADNYFNNNSGDGLDVLSNRAITLNTITTNSNNGYGAYIDNCGYNSGTGTCTSTITPAPGVTLTGNNNFIGNTQYGLWLTSKGAITVSNLTANNNSLGGAYLDNCAFNGASCTTSTVAAVTLTGYANFVGNSNQLNDGKEDGLDIYSAGAITVNNLMAIYNDGTGAWLEDCLWNGTKCTGSGNITLTGTNTFSYNYGDGLYADTHGSITLNNVTADNNGGIGVWGVADGSILVACGSMTNNGGYGWSFAAGTTATLKGVFAYGNNGGHGNTEPAYGTFTYVRTCP